MKTRQLFHSIGMGSAILCLTGITACHSNNHQELSWELEPAEHVFGFPGEQRYTYCPSILSQKDGTAHMFFCANPISGQFTDNIYHLTIRPGREAQRNDAKSVLQPGAKGTWDDQHVCDPSVVEGKFMMDGNIYKYAMLYLGSSLKYYYNEIGIAFSNDLNADNWVKYPAQIVPKTWTEEGDWVYPSGGKAWGVGQPSAVSLDKKGRVLLTYTVGDKEGTRLMWREADFSNMDHFTLTEAQKVITDGLLKTDGSGQDYIANAEIAINRKADKIVMIRPVHPFLPTYPSFIAHMLEVCYMNLSDFMLNQGQWMPMHRISPHDTGFPRNHNVGIARDNFGFISNWSEPLIYYTVSQATPDVDAGTGNHCEWTYQIWRRQLKASK